MGSPQRKAGGGPPDAQGLRRATSWIRAAVPESASQRGKPSDVALERVNVNYWPHSLMILLVKNIFPVPLTNLPSFNHRDGGWSKTAVSE